MPVVDLTGQKFGRLTVKRFSHSGPSGKAQWLCGCDCGQELTADGYNLKCGNTASCGCLRREVTAKRVFKTGLCRSPEYGAHQNMMSRCYDAADPRFSTYGARGITVCDRWHGEHGFENFLADMGRKPAKNFSIDRIDNDKGYSPKNCQWATKYQQARNKTNNVRVSVDGEVMILREACKRLGVKYGTALSRRTRGCDVEVVLGGSHGRSVRYA